jgi:cell division protein FtsW
MAAPKPTTKKLTPKKPVTKPKSTSKQGSKSAKSTRRGGGYDWGLLTVVMALLALGLIMVFSSSYARALVNLDNPLYFIMRQLMWTGLGLVVLIVAARINYSLWEQFSIPLMGLALVMLLALIPMGSETFGATRTYFGGSVQPSEPAKIVIIIYVSAWLASKGSLIQNVRVGLVPFSVLMGIVTVLIVTQPDISTAILIVTTASIMFFIAGAKLRQLLIIGVGIATTFALVINYSSYASDRVSKYWNGLQDPLQGSEWQTVQSVQAIVNGGPFGVGPGNSVAKLPGYLPLSWTDNIFAIIGEELGLLGALLVILLFALFAYRGLRIALMSRDNFGTLLATGITSIVVLQALLNAAVVVAVAPATGVTLPFISYGGSSLVTVLGAVGILLSISRYSSQVSGVGRGLGDTAYARFNFGWRDGGARVSRAGRRGTTQSSRSRSGSRTTKAKSTGTKSASAKSAGSKSSKKGTRRQRTGTRRVSAR